MASQCIESYRSSAEIVLGDDLFRLQPRGRLRVANPEEEKDHVFKQNKRAVSYAPEVTAFVEKCKLKKMSEVKTKELLLLWLSVVEVYFKKPTSEKLTFKTGTGLSDSFPASAFEQNE
ncbi:hypothetical protein HPP92_024621 [Vanilla planifolia]|uniref:Uncharacterized protein n=1 Tax=Vanilla planifolia TaxID=51239 RepID=A0A835U7C4_VANPL|nr:hypothetical protein HPP92_026586 [Vanilla planifolia]KAG0456833.1 hypothetical protein HPP92_024621 [Vanilla planifolia]